MKELKNPFEYDAAANLPLDIIEKVYIEDHNFSRFILSSRNIYLLGERGSGKSMMLIYNSFRLKLLRDMQSKEKANYDFIGIHVPCKNPLFNKTEYELLDDKDLASMLSEHYLVLVILHSLACSLENSEEINKSINLEECYTDFEYLVGEKLPKKENLFIALKMYSQKCINKTEQFGASIEIALNDLKFHSFQSLIIPVLDLIKSSKLLNKSHFMIMIDDAHDLNQHQIRKINSWIAYRDHSTFSIKVATADVYRHSMHTDFDGCIVEGHDFMSINMEKTFQSSNSPFYNLAKDIIERRLSLFSPGISAEEFFPTNPSLKSDLEACKKRSREHFESKHPSATKKQINDHIYKAYRVDYFRGRADKANKPPYSGFDILVHSSTGVIRNLLAPCFSMYDIALSEQKSKPESISPKIQKDILFSYSERLWTHLRSKKLSDELIDCTEEQAIEISNFFEKLGDLFTERLKEHLSEPRVLTFTISGMSSDYSARIEPIFNIARRALLLYERSGPAKDSGRRETYFVPNRMLWIARGLDPVGQHGRASIPAKDIIAAFEGRPLPYTEEKIELFKQQEMGFYE